MSRWIQVAGAVLLVGGLAACGPADQGTLPVGGTTTVTVTAAANPTDTADGKTTGVTGGSSYSQLQQAFDGATDVDVADYKGLVTSVGFESPDKVVTCGIEDDAITCQAHEGATFTPPKDCHGMGSGRAVTMADHKAPEFACMGDVESGGPVLGDGTRITVGALQCVSREGITCIDGDGHGFRLGTGSYLLTGGGAQVPSSGGPSAPTTTQAPQPTTTAQPTTRSPHSTSALTGHYFVGAGTFNMNGSDGNYYGVWFLGDEWAYWGRPTSGAPRCTAVTGSIGSQPGDGWGCVRYSYDASSGALTVGGHSGSYRNGELEVGDWSFSPTLLPAAGTRVAVNLMNRGYSGMCGLYGGCSTWSTSLAMTDDGHFVLTSGSISSFSGSGSFGWASDYPPDKKGTYQVEAGGRIRLHYDSGKTEVRTFAEKYDAAGHPDPADASGDAGVVFGADRFWRDDA
ncbi:hypothetical protein [Flexivirga oryzae]|uniref:Uncharacterized protein n=1 Tax=Flexivirga oryzae TaxID=1794944 RepID=A0A839N4B8_9MICO|nr:hypothetical protein [Flexivirga oryzae]MBB2890486.1 hypothetical protein [Flexivirga oryzae]